MTFYKTYFIVIIFMFFSLSLTAMSRWTDLYQIKNVSKEDLTLTVHYSGYDEFNLFPTFYHWLIDREIVNIPLPYQSPEPFILFECYPEEEWKMTAAGHYEWVFNETRSAREMLGKVLEELTVYDTEGNIVLTLDDIHEENFEYLDKEKRLSPCIMITAEMIEAGRRKYAQDG